MRGRQGILTIVIAVYLTISVTAATPYQNYTYDKSQETQAEPQAYVPVQAVSGVIAGTIDFSEPQDIFVAENSNIYIADTGNNRIVVLNKEMHFVQEIKEFQNNGQIDTFQKTSGIYVTKENELYIADTENQRIVVLQEDGSLKKIVGEPKTMDGELTYTYNPIKIAVDFADRIYVVSKNCSNGIIEFDKDDSFLGYYGAVQTQPDLMYLFWKSIATEAQKAAMTLTIPTEYSSLDIDAKSFIYGTVSAIDTDNFSSSMFIHKLNPIGTDVLKRNGFSDPMGDVKYIKENENGIPDISKLCDVSVQDNGVYSVLDSNKGRVFTYNDAGELLYIYGGIGENLGTFGNPIAIDVTADKHSLVLDSKYNQIVEFKPTEYAKLMLQAIQSNAERKYDDAANFWKDTLKYTSESSVVFKEIGNVYYNQGLYDKAMQYYKLAYDNASYSNAYKYWRMEYLSKNFGIFMTSLIVIIGILIVIKFILRKRAKERL